MTILRTVTCRGALVSLALSTSACGTGSSASRSASPGPAPDLHAAIDTRNYAAMKARADAAGALSGDSVASTYPTAFATLDYAPLSAQYLDRIQASALALTDGENAALAKNGFVISTGREFPTFVRGFAEIYSEHLPVYVSADAILESVHSAYDSMLLRMEQATVINDVIAPS